MKFKKHVARAIAHAGSQRELAKKAGVTQQTISLLLRGGKCSAETAVGIDKATDGIVSRHDLRPDIFGVRP